MLVKIAVNSQRPDSKSGRFIFKQISMYRTINKQNFRTKAKYKNKTQRYGGRTYHSIREANHAEELDWRKKAGEVLEWKPQHKIDLRVNGRHIAYYYVDFRVVMADGSVQYHEVKGMVLPLWQIKWALLEATIDEIETGTELLVIR